MVVVVVVMMALGQCGQLVGKLESGLGGLLVEREAGQR